MLVHCFRDPGHDRGEVEAGGRRGTRAPTRPVRPFPDITASSTGRPPFGYLRRGQNFGDGVVIRRSIETVVPLPVGQSARPASTGVTMSSDVTFSACAGCTATLGCVMFRCLIVDDSFGLFSIGGEVARLRGPHSIVGRATSSEVAAAWSKRFSQMWRSSMSNSATNTVSS